MFDYDITQKSHFTGKDGEQSFVDWKKKMGIDGDGFEFRVNAKRTDRRGFAVYFNVVSWGFYQGSDWRWYVFISYRSSDNKTTAAYHWDVDADGKPVGTPRRHVWSQ
jgi:hypothetical protein